MVILYWLLIIGAVFIKKPKIFPFFVIAFLVWINYNNIKIPDFLPYNNLYQAALPVQYKNFGEGWYFLNNIGRNLGLTYNQYKMWSLILIGIILFIVSRILIGETSNLMWGLYLLCPALVDVIQLRFYTALAITLLAIPFILKKKLWSTLVAICIILFASKVHSSAHFYLLLIFCPLAGKDPKKFRNLLFAFTAVAIVFRSLTSTILNNFLNERTLTYVDPNSTATAHGTLLIPLFIVDILLVFLTNNYIANIVVGNSIFSTEDINYMSFVRNASALMFVLIPISLISGEFFRVFRIMYILTYISIAILAKPNRKYMSKSFLFGSSPVYFKAEYVGIAFVIVMFAINILYLLPSAYSSFFR
ncbi:EpsG family protein [Lactobacillus delbrueckii]|uniref:EpsG family protein n=1 Tax=Lactobacillus delbrueckii TaxID=1584 RepID=UPI0037C8C071